MLLFFTCGCLSVWWDFKNPLFDEMVEKSIKTPIFALLYSPSCSHCKGLPELLRNLSAQDPDRTDVMFTTVNCNYMSHCAHFHMSGTPSIQMIIGPDRIYWPSTNERDPVKWDAFIKHYTNYTIKEISSELELKEMASVASQGAYFHVEVKSKNDPLLIHIQSIVRKFIIFQCNFSFRVNNKINQTEIYAYRSPNCSIKYQGPLDISNVEEFIDKNKFGVLHQYRYAEWIAENKNQRTITLFTYDVIDSNQTETLIKMSQNRCRTTSVGWVAAKTTKELMRITKINMTELPSILVSNRATGCSSIHSDDIDYLERSGSIQTSLNSLHCMNRFKGMWATELIKQKLTGKWIAFIMFVSGLAAVIIIRISDTYPSKEE